MKRSDYFLIALFILQLFFYQIVLTNLKFFFVSIKFSSSPINHLISILYALFFIVVFVNFLRLMNAYKNKDTEEADNKIQQVLFGSVAAIAINFLIVILSARLP